MAIQTIPNLKTQINTLIPDNASGQISPADIRTNLIDAADSLAPVDHTHTNAEVNTSIAASPAASATAMGLGTGDSVTFTSVTASGVGIASAGSVTCGSDSAFGVTLRSAIYSPSNGEINFRNWANSDFSNISAKDITASGAVTAADYKYSSATFVTEATTARTLTNADHGKTILCTNASAVAITVPTGLVANFWCSIVQIGAGTVTFSGAATLNTAGSLSTSAQFASLSLANYGTADTYLV